MLHTEKINLYITYLLRHYILSVVSAMCVHIFPHHQHFKTGSLHSLFTYN